MAGASNRLSPRFGPDRGCFPLARGASAKEFRGRLLVQPAGDGRVYYAQGGMLSVLEVLPQDWPQEAVFESRLSGPSNSGLRRRCPARAGTLEASRPEQG